MIGCGRITAHLTCMLLAFACSAIFLVSHIFYHVHGGTIHFQGQGWTRAGLLCSADLASCWLSQFCRARFHDSLTRARTSVWPPLPRRALYTADLVVYLGRWRNRLRAAVSSLCDSGHWMKVASKCTRKTKCALEFLPQRPRDPILNL
jgi:hypothetical protein